jgi:hypothetical protein
LLIAAPQRVPLARTEDLIVMPGLEPGIQKTLDCRVKAGNDNESSECAAALAVLLQPG